MPLGVSDLGTFARIQAVGVVAPGALLLLEASTIFRADGNTVLAEGIRASHGVSATILILGVIVLLLAAYVVGLFCRTLAWRLIFTPLFLNKARRVEELVESDRGLSRNFGAQVIDGILAGHPALDHALRLGRGDDNDASIDVRDSAYGASMRYCKYWLRARSPELTIDQIELEINFLVGISAVCCLAPTAIAAAYGWPWFAWGYTLAACLLVGCVFAVWILRRASRRRYEEIEDALGNFFVAQMWT
jgi:hypothetical protein